MYDGCSCSGMWSAWSQTRSLFAVAVAAASLHPLLIWVIGDVGVGDDVDRGDATVVMSMQCSYEM